MDYDNKNKGAIWIKTAKTGLVYKAGTLNVEGKEYKITMFDNQYKRISTHPDFNIVIEPIENNKDPSSIKQTDITKQKTVDTFEEITLDDIPF